eukprot:Lithocolla_globosa_v1_NODE_4937_length_1335_cov_12.213281.p3 type:complete len:169 gc:universal NODE_4937_length_1335_cov_12.213281:823-1329(+)
MRVIRHVFDLVFREVAGIVRLDWQILHFHLLLILGLSADGTYLLLHVNVEGILFHFDSSLPLPSLPRFPVFDHNCVALCIQHVSVRDGKGGEGCVSRFGHGYFAAHVASEVELVRAELDLRADLLLERTIRLVSFHVHAACSQFGPNPNKHFFFFLHFCPSFLNLRKM